MLFDSLFSVFFQQVLGVLDELESLKPEVDRQVGGLNKAHSRTEDFQQNDIGKNQNGSRGSFQLPDLNNNVPFRSDSNQVISATVMFIQIDIIWCLLICFIPLMLLFYCSH